MAPLAGRRATLGVVRAHRRGVRLSLRTRSEGDDAISSLAREAARAELINTAEAADMLGVIMIAGNETTANLIGNGLWLLVRHPDQMERLREEPDRAQLD